MPWTKWDRSVRALIRSPIKWQDRSIRHGQIYILYDPQSNHIKIGRTRNAVSRRLRDVRKLHGRPHTYHVWSSPLLGAGNLYRLEQLVLTDLKIYQSKYTCYTCNGRGAIHREWFDIAVEDAKLVIMLWYDWLKYRLPYHATGDLRQEWQLRTRSMTPDTSARFADRFDFWRQFAEDEFE